MPICALCNNLKKRNRDDQRLAFDFTPGDLVQSAGVSQCLVCKVLLDGILRFEGPWKLNEDVTRIYLIGLTRQEDSLTLEIYFSDDRPKLVLEFYRGEHEQSACKHFTSLSYGVSS